jgi:GNAT superfamily N-acetyltransferase
MRLSRVNGGTTRWNRGREFISEHAGYLPDWFMTARARTHQMWALEETTGGSFNEVTEEVTGRPVVAVVLTERDMYVGANTLIVVHPRYRQQGWGTRLLTWLLQSFSSRVYVMMDTADPAAMAFAARLGRFEDSWQDNGRLLAHVRFGFDNRNWRHAGCRCAHCQAELSSLGLTHSDEEM